LNWLVALGAIPGIMTPHRTWHPQYWSAT